MTQTLASNVNNNIQNVAPNDIYLDAQGNIALSFDLQAVLEECAQVAKTLLGEMVFNTDLGIPYFETVWVGVPNIPQFTAALRRSFFNVDGVIEIISLQIRELNNVLTYTVEIRTIFGSGVVNG